MNINKMYKLTGWLLSAMLFALAAPGIAQAQELVVVVAKDSPIPELSASQVREVFMGDTTRLYGARLAPVMYVDGDPLQEAFLNRVLRTRTAAFNSHWMQRVFQSGGKPPKRVASDSQAVTAVLSASGGIGFVTTDALAGARNLRVVYRVGR